MSWKEAKFKDKKVWVQVDVNGNPMRQRGLSPIRYSGAEGAKIYNAKADSVTVVGDKLIALPEGKSKSAKSPSMGFGSAKNRSNEQKQRAKQHVVQMLESFSKETVVCFTDGSCRGNPGPAGTGVLVRLSDGKEIEHYRYLGTGTNNTAEISAVIDALEIIDIQNVPDEVPVEIMTDSKYVYGLVHLGWKAKANQGLIKTLRTRISIRGNIRLHWVAGHAGIEENERADQLANRAIEEKK
jgi:ribonuclease HI